MNDQDGDDQPESEPADRRAKNLRERAMDLLADTSIHVQRLQEISERAGLAPDLLDGVGDRLYEMVIAQLDLAATVAERSHAAAERLLQYGASRKQPRFHRLVLEPDQPSVRFDFSVHNASLRSAAVEAHVEFVPGGANYEVGHRHLPSGQHTSIEVTIHRSKMEAGVHAGAVDVTLVHAGRQRVTLRRVGFEVWVRG
jgi:hypothetical protein